MPKGSASRDTLEVASTWFWNPLPGSAVPAAPAEPTSLVVPIPQAGAQADDDSRGG